MCSYLIACMLLRARHSVHGDARDGPRSVRAQGCRGIRRGIATAGKFATCALKEIKLESWPVLFPTGMRPVAESMWICNRHRENDLSVRLFYVDESYDQARFCLSAIGIRHVDWRDCFQMVRQHRAILKQDHGVFLRKEVHAHEFVSGRGRISPSIISKHERSRIFDGLLKLVASLPNVMIINICLDVAGRKNPQLDAWDRLMNRVERMLLEMERRELPLRKRLVAALPDRYPDSARGCLETRLNAYRSRAVIFADQGRETEITRALRKMSVFNPIPSQFGGWSSELKTKNIPLERIIEDPVFKQSHQSYMIQLADCVAFSLLKREVPPTPLIKKYGIHRMFEKNIADVCLRAASRKDPLGIVRK